MALFETTRSSDGLGFGGHLQSLFATLRQWNDSRVTRKALTALSDHELDDIGLCRGDIDSVASVPFRA